MPTVLLTAPYILPFKQRFLPVFSHYGIEIIAPAVKERLSEEEILAFAGQFQGTICGDDQYSRDVIKKCSPELKVISKWGTGIDSIDCKAADEMGVMVGNTPNAFTLPVSDSTMGYILAFARRQPWMDRAIKSGVWEKLPGRSLSECTLGVVGIGNIGKAVIRRANAFGMQILGNDIIPIAPDFLLENKVEMVDIVTLVRKSDFVSIHCDLNPTSRHLIDSQKFQLMKPSAVIINTARGPIVDEQALIDALIGKVIAGAALDVFETEPLPDDSPLKKMDNVLLGAHNSNSSPSAWERVHWNTIRNLLIGMKIPHDDFKDIQKKYSIA